MSTCLICPVCRLPLQAETKKWVCGTGHSFDFAREGYVNLIHGKAPAATQGDSAEMVRARRAFLARGFYQPLAKAVAEAVADGPAQTVADIGCGEGYYLREVMRLLEDVVAYGTDISKAAVAAAAKSTPGAQFAVADTNRLIPLADSSLDAGICVFAPRNAAEFARVIRPGGRLVVAIPGREHLASLREKFGLIGIEEDKTVKISEQLGEFELEYVRQVGAEITLDRVALRELIEMTPNARHSSEEQQAQIAEVGEMRTDAHFEVLTFIRK